MSETVYIGGRFHPAEAAAVSVFDHGLLYGDGVFEGIRAYNGRVFRLERHIERLYDSAKAIRLAVPLAPDEMTQAVLETCRRNQIVDGYIRLVVTRGAGDLSVDPRSCACAEVVVIARPVAALYAGRRATGITVITSLHVLELAQAYGRRIIALRDGRVVHDGPPESLTGSAASLIFGGAPA